MTITDDQASTRERRAPAARNADGTRVRSAAAQRALDKRRKRLGAKRLPHAPHAAPGFVLPRSSTSRRISGPSSVSPSRLYALRCGCHSWSWWWCCSSPALP